MLNYTTIDPYNASLFKQIFLKNTQSGPQDWKMTLNHQQNIEWVFSTTEFKHDLQNLIQLGSSQYVPAINPLNVLNVSIQLVCLERGLICK